MKISAVLRYDYINTNTRNLFKVSHHEIVITTINLELIQIPSNAPDLDQYLGIPTSRHRDMLDNNVKQMNPLFTSTKRLHNCDSSPSFIGTASLSLSLLDILTIISFKPWAKIQQAQANNHHKNEIKALLQKEQTTKSTQTGAEVINNNP